jgi:RNA-directed DNA polymerase
MEGVASHHGPGSCVGGGNTAGEAWTGVRAGQPLSSEIKQCSGAPTAFRCREGHTGRRVHRERRPGPTESKTLACAEALCSRTGRSQRLPTGLRARGRSGKACGRNPDMHAAGKSDIGVVPENVPNKAGSGEVGGHGGTGNPLRNRKGGDGNPPPTPAGIVRLTRRRRHGRKGRWPRATSSRRPQTGH